MNGEFSLEVLRIKMRIYKTTQKHRLFHTNPSQKKGENFNIIIIFSFTLVHHTTGNKSPFIL